MNFKVRHKTDSCWNVLCENDVEINVRLGLQPNGEWYAIDDNEYDAESDSAGYWSNSPQGFGETRIAAIYDLLEQIEEDAGK